MSRITANSSNLTEVIQHSQPVFEDTASIVAIGLYSLLLLDMVAFSLAAPNVSSWVLWLIEHSLFGLEPGYDSSLVFFTVFGLILLAGAILKTRASRWAHGMKQNLRLALPTKEWTARPDVHLLRLILWLIALPAAITLAVAMANALDLSAWLGLMAYPIAVICGLIVSWVSVAIALGLMADRYAVIGLIISLCFFLLAFVYGPGLRATLGDIPPWALTSNGVMHLQFYGASAFLVILAILSLLAREMERDVRVVSLVVTDGSNEHTYIEYNPVGINFSVPVWLTIAPQNAQIVVFHRAIIDQRFKNIDLDRVSREMIRVDNAQLRVINLTAMSKKFRLGLECGDAQNGIVIRAKINIDPSGSNLAGSRTRTYSPVVLQTFADRFLQSANLDKILKEPLDDLARTEYQAIEPQLRSVQGYLRRLVPRLNLTGVNTGLDSADVTNFLNANLAAATSEIRQVADEMAVIMNEIRSYEDELAAAAQRIADIPAKANEYWRRTISRQTQARSLPSSPEDESQVFALLDAIGFRVNVSAVVPPPQLAALQSKMEDIWNQINSVLNSSRDKPVDERRRLMDFVNQLISNPTVPRPIKDRLLSMMQEPPTVSLADVAGRPRLAIRPPAQGAVTAPATAPASAAPPMRLRISKRGNPPSGSDPQTPM